MFNNKIISVQTMQDIRTSIISTLAHYEAERGLPLSAFEIHKYLHKKNSEKIKLSQILKELEHPEITEYNIENKNGFYFLLNEEKTKNKYSQRINRDKLSIKKWKKAKKMIWLMQAIPFVKSISVAGSLSMNNTLKDSDIDLFLMVKKGRIWTARTLSMLLTQLLGQRRYDKKINNKICLNYYITEESEPQIKNLASANVFLRTIPVYGITCYNNFLKNNSYWIEKYFQNPQNKFKIENFRKIKKNKVFLKLKTLSEYMLSKKIGDKLEKILSLWQRKRIEKKIKKEKNITNLIFTDKILMFHWPNPRNKEVLEKYNSIIKKFKIQTTI